MNKRVLKISLLILAIILPFITFFTVVECLKNPYDKTYLAAIFDQYERLNSVEGKKIVFVGGSSLPFGLRSDLIEEDLNGDYKVRNFGLYATLGTKYMLDLSKKSISEGDVIVISPEINKQTYSLYFNPQAVLEATDGASSLAKHLSIKDNLSLFYNYYKYAFKKISYLANGNAPDPTDIYRRSALNEYGDIEAERKNNIMNNCYDSNMLISFSDELFDEEFFNYINEYIAYAEKRGATVFFNYSPLNRTAIRSSKAKRAEFEERLKDVVNCELLGTIEDYVIDERYFYDTNFHLNSAGAIYFSRILSLNLQNKLGYTPSTSIDVPEPPVPEANSTVIVNPNETPTDFKKYTGEPNIDYADCFTYQLVTSPVSSTYMITGVKPEYKSIKEVILPSVFEGKNVTAIAKDAFYGCTELERIHIGLTYKELAESSFNGCISLQGIYIYQTEGNRIIPPSTGLMNGCSDKVKIYIPKGANYQTGYIWSNYESRFESFILGGENED